MTYAEWSYVYISNPYFIQDTETVKFFQCSINIYNLQDKHYFLDCLNWEQQIINDKIIYNKCYTSLPIEK